MLIVNTYSMLSVCVCTCTCVSVHTSATYQPSLSLSLCIRCVCTGTASRARRGSGGDSERNVRWFCWSRNSSGPPKEPAQAAAAVPRRREDCNPPWWVHKNPEITPTHTIHGPSDAYYMQKWQELKSDWLALCSQSWGVYQSVFFIEWCCVK